MIKVICGDITKLNVDVIVNAANPDFLPGAGVDGAIRHAAGHELSEACERLKSGVVGEVRLTRGFRLPAKYVIHAVGPVWQGGDQGEAELLHRCYRESFKLAMDNDSRSIAFPCISTGVYGYPKQQAAEIALEEMMFFDNRFAEIIACCYSEEDEKIYSEILGY